MPTDADLLRTINRGIPGTEMPSFKSILTDDEKQAVIAYLKTFFPPGENAAPPAPISIPEVPANLESHAQTGRYVYMLMECWNCHGTQGRGNGMLADSLKDAWGNVIHPRNLTRLPYKAGSDPESIYRTLATGMNGTPMPVFDDMRMLFGSNYQVDEARFHQLYSQHEINGLIAWLHSQPNDGALQNMSADQKRELAQKRRWALVGYVESLIKPTNFLVKMFGENTETTH